MYLAYLYYFLIKTLILKYIEMIHPKNAQNTVKIPSYTNLPYLEKKYLSKIFKESI